MEAAFPEMGLSSYDNNRPASLPFNNNFVIKPSVRIITVFPCRAETIGFQKEIL